MFSPIVLSHTFCDRLRSCFVPFQVGIADGWVFADLNRNGQWDSQTTAVSAATDVSDEPGLPGVRVHILDAHGVEHVAVTDSRGRWERRVHAGIATMFFETSGSFDSLLDPGWVAYSWTQQEDLGFDGPDHPGEGRDGFGDGRSGSGRGLRRAGGPGEHDVENHRHGHGNGDDLLSQTSLNEETGDRVWLAGGQLNVDAGDLIIFHLRFFFGCFFIAHIL